MFPSSDFAAPYGHIIAQFSGKRKTQSEGKPLMAGRKI